MTNKGFPVMMVSYVMNHGAECYRVFNPKTNQIVITRDVQWSDFKDNQLSDDYTFFEPDIDSSQVDTGVKIGENESVTEDGASDSHASTITSVDDSIDSSNGTSLTKEKA